MNKVVQIEDLIPIITEQLEKGGNICFTPKGTSMLPLFRDNRDVVVLSPPQYPLKRKTIVFYQRKNGQYILHRFIKKSGDDYVMRGDNQVTSEYGIKKENIIAVVTEFSRKNKKYTTNSILYRLYSTFWVKTVCIRKFYWLFRKGIWKIKRKIKKIIKRIVGLK